VLAAAATGALEAMGTTVAEDEALLAAGGLEPRRRLAVQVCSAWTLAITSAQRMGREKLLIWRGGDASAAEQPCSQWRFRGNREHNIPHFSRFRPIAFARTMIHEVRGLESNSSPRGEPLTRERTGSKIDGNRSLLGYPSMSSGYGSSAPWCSTPSSHTALVYQLGNFEPGAKRTVGFDSWGELTRQREGLAEEAFVAFCGRIWLQFRLEKKRLLQSALDSWTD